MYPTKNIQYGNATAVLNLQTTDIDKVLETTNPFHLHFLHIPAFANGIPGESNQTFPLA